MSPDNLTRLQNLAEETFRTRQDPDQLSVDEEVMGRLHALHPCTLTQENTPDGPIAWILVIPTTTMLMQEFVAGRISERKLFLRTQPGDRFTALYLCSALVLEEYRGKGLAKRLMIKAVEGIRAEYPIEALFSWEFTMAGKHLARAIARACGLPCHERAPHTST